MATIFSVFWGLDTARILCLSRVPARVFFFERKFLESRSTIVQIADTEKSELNESCFVFMMMDISTR